MDAQVTASKNRKLARLDKADWDAVRILHHGFTDGITQRERAEMIQYCKAAFFKTPWTKLKSLLNGVSSWLLSCVSRLRL